MGLVEADEVLVALTRPEGYEDVHPDLVVEDAKIDPAFEWRVLASGSPVDMAESAVGWLSPDASRSIMDERQDALSRLAVREAQLAALAAKARDVIARWETPLWKDAPSTASFIYALRDALPPER